ncbi:malate dehydrogenase, putative [Talaromyces stipitatus ATCC 10500]|uniref:Malate dehydrogenase n=1 Tax=Talaromyces stipitatus (strain ATCC 10500 / CBS 375.48 / QM 6759 / NRRL 1006) TaxID=441959 RepID=B8MU58_TALSN|nr:malate dehydrogenase, putative [Talaromyces stipitatus ATCC 10500]EED11776.1 malate dehydrogenase, putative [Talaromyces stipitatus ATCC 10500]
MVKGRYGLVRKPRMTRDDRFEANAGIVRSLVKGIAEFSPKAFVLIVSNLVNSTVAGVFDPKRLFGVTTLDVVRAETFVQEYTRPAFEIPADKYDALVNSVQFSGGEVVKAKDGAASATFSMAYAGFRFVESVIKALNQRYGVSQ